MIIQQSIYIYDHHHYCSCCKLRATDACRCAIVNRCCLYFTYCEGGGASVGGELPLERPVVLELVAGSDDPEPNHRLGVGVGVVAADPSVNSVVIHLSFELWLHGIAQQDGLLVGQWNATRCISVCRTRHVSRYII
uniref:Uncharacterized protein n=1 Tax=Arundo donax TaxID=35708 RepID=A0A0A9D0H0_ARUDO